MAQISIVNSSDLEGATRLDAEYYQPEYLRILRRLEKQNAPKIREVAQAMKRKFTPRLDDYFDYIEISDISKLGEVTATRILGKEAPSRAQRIVRENDILVSTVRPIRNAVALIQTNQDGFVCSTGFCVLKPTQVTPEYIFAFLKMPIIARLLDRLTAASMYPAISENNILDLRIPLPSQRAQKQIQKFVREMYQSLENSEALYQKAEQAILDEIGFSEINLSHQPFYSVSLSEAQGANRLDAEHFQPKYEGLIEHLKKSGRAKQLGEVLSEPIQKGITPEYVPEGEIIIINSQHLGQYNLNIDHTERTTKSFWEANKRAQIQHLDVMIYATGAYIGRTNTYLENQPALAGVDILLARPKLECRPEYLSVYLNSKPGLLQAESFAAGSAQRHLYPEHVSKFIIHLPSKEFQNHIADLAHQSYQARQKAKELLEEAKQVIENLIETRK